MSLDFIHQRIAELENDYGKELDGNFPTDPGCYCRPCVDAKVKEIEAELSK